MNVIKAIIRVWSGMKLIVRIAIGLVIGAILGLVAPELTGIEILGQIFVSALKAVAPRTCNGKHCEIGQRTGSKIQHSDILLPYQHISGSTMCCGGK